MKLDIAAAILTGGQARRFLGRDKSRLVVEGRTILDRQLSMLSPLVTRILIVTSAARLPEFHDVDGARAIVDQYPDGGPLGGVLTALAAAPGHPVFVLGGDMPSVTGALVDALARRHASTPADVTAPVSPRGFEPLAALYAQSAVPGLQRALASGDLSLQRAVRALRLSLLPAPDVAAAGDPAALFRNINTPEDLGHA